VAFFSYGSAKEIFQRPVLLLQGVIQVISMGHTNTSWCVGVVKNKETVFQLIDTANCFGDVYARQGQFAKTRLQTSILLCDNF